MAHRAAHAQQRGFFLIVLVLVLLLAGGVGLLSRLSSTASRVVAQEGENREKLELIRDALVNFVSANSYLPCPAVGTLATGVAAPASANSCANPDGTVPWATLGLRSADVNDPFDNKISYRVFSGATGLTQAGGASMANCDSARAPLPTPQTVGADAATGLCRTDHNTSPGEFLSGKGLSVTDSGTSVTSVAFVLISHGKNGLGAYGARGVRNDMPDVASSEYGHTQTSGPFMIKAANTAGLAPTDTAYFDDSLAYLTISDLAGRAKVMARDWPDPP